MVAPFRRHFQEVFHKMNTLDSIISIYLELPFLAKERHGDATWFSHRQCLESGIQFLENSTQDTARALRPGSGQE